MVTIADALFSRTQQRVLALLYGQPNKSFYTNEIVRWADMGRGTVRRELQRLTSAGLLTLTREGNQHHYQADAANPIYHELVGIVRKTFGVADVIRAALEPGAPSIVSAFIYGSVAKGTDSAASDIDVMVITDTLSYGDVVDLLSSCEQQVGRAVNPVVFASNEFVDKLEQDTAFLTRVLEQPKIMLIGSEDDIPRA